MYLKQFGIGLSVSALMLCAKEAAPADRIHEAAKVFHEIQAAKDKGIPSKLLEKANGIIIVPGLKRAGFVVGGEYGKGVFVVRTATGWSAPSTIRVEGGSIGLQIGAGETDLILLAMNQDAVTQLMKTGVKIGGDIMGAAGPIGRQAEADTTAIPAGGLLSYSRARGVFAGVDLKGTTLRSDDGDNEKIYGRRVDQSDILGGKIRPTPAAQPLLAELRRYFRANPQTEPGPGSKPGKKTAAK
jgi:lipid-binding SYLF domain-containing protein